MKRTLLLSITIVAAISVTAQAYVYSNSSFRNRVRWSMEKQGLISGYVRYSPYAYKYGSTGLVPGNYSYTPYALKYGSNGLVPDPRYGYRGYSVTYLYGGGNVNTAGYSGTSCYSASVPAVKTKSSCRPEAKTEKQQTAKICMEQKSDPADLIQAYLIYKKIEFTTDRYLRISGKTISVDFHLKDKNIIIKYWNPQEIVALKNQNDLAMNYYNRYLETWKEFGGNYLSEGGDIYQIISSDEDEILAKLYYCEKINS